MHIPAHYPGLIKSSGLTCQRLEAPEVPEVPEQDNGTTAESTFQLPFGDFSALSELRLGNLKNVEALLMSVLHYRNSSYYL